MCASVEHCCMWDMIARFEKIYLPSNLMGTQWDLQFCRQIVSQKSGAHHSTKSAVLSFCHMSSSNGKTLSWCWLSLKTHPNLSHTWLTASAFETFASSASRNFARLSWDGNGSQSTILNPACCCWPLKTPPISSTHKLPVGPKVFRFWNLDDKLRIILHFQSHWILKDYTSTHRALWRWRDLCMQNSTQKKHTENKGVHRLLGCSWQSVNQVLEKLIGYGVRKSQSPQ